ncbi:MAG: hypothetical protein ACI4O5_01500 [Oscillospiraceae bacterium]
MEKTANYQLNQWDAADPIRREDFNADNAAIDAALAALGETAAAHDETVAGLAANLGTAGKNCRLAVGAYTGNGTCGASKPCTLSANFYITAAMVACSGDNSIAQIPVIFLRGCTVAKAAGSATSAYNIVSWKDTSVSWYCTQELSNYQLNANCTYYYLLFGYEP